MRLVRCAVAMLLGLTFLTGCQAEPGPTAVDRTFVADMAPHHALGIRMSSVALRQADDVRVREFGFEMGRYQQAEFNRLAALARHWNAEPSAHIHGMLTEAEEHALAALSGADFDRAWLTEMIRHHEGAVAMAQIEATDGRHRTARKIAADIVTVQGKEITQMTAALADLRAL